MKDTCHFKVVDDAHNNTIVSHALSPEQLLHQFVDYRICRMLTNARNCIDFICMVVEENTRFSEHMVLGGMYIFLYTLTKIYSMVSVHT